MNVFFKMMGIAVFLGISQNGRTQELKRKSRAESYFGLHFDFHANREDRDIGKTLSRGMIDSMLQSVKPDFIQVDCKGHPGISSYPTMAGNQAGSYTEDVMKLWREETARYGVALYVHYSGVLDTRAIELHPNWAAKDTAGKSSLQETSRQSAYADSLLIPQLKELAGKYQVDGAWVDGDCWAARRDYSPLSLAAFKASTGITHAPFNASQPGWAAWTDFTRQSFKTYMRHYIDAIHAFKPGFQITSNWSYTGYMPEPVDINVDFISGDVASTSCVYSAAFESRCIAHQGKPWDLMSWGFSYSFPSSFGSPKSDVQLEQEASEIMSNGGSYQIYYTQNRDASIKPWIVPQAARIATFCRQRQNICKNASNIPEVAVLYSTHAFYKYARIIYDYNPDVISNDIKGLTMGLLDSRFSTEILMEHSLHGRMSRYAVIVVPNWKELDPGFRDELAEYARKGGRLVLVGTDPVKMFAAETGIAISKVQVRSHVNLGYEGNMSTLLEPICHVTLPKNAESFGGLYQSEDLRSAHSPAAAIVPFGKGKIACLFTGFGSTYIWKRSQLPNKLLADLIWKMKPALKLTVSGSDNLHTNLTEKSGSTFIHLINTQGSHDNEKVFEYDHIEPLNQVSLSIERSARPRAVLLQPENRVLPFQYLNGKVIVKVPQVSLYSIVEVK